MLRWARERAGLGVEDLTARFPKLALWESGELSPTMKQLEAFAHATYTSFGLLLLPEPPQEPLPIPDFRTIAGRTIRRPSPNLLDTIYICQDRQDWYLEFAHEEGRTRLPFVGSLTLQTPIPEAAARMRQALQFDLDDRRDCPTWTEALRRFVALVDKSGVLVMSNSVVQNNNHRKLNVEEFRGFALSDQVAPLIFINGADSKSAQMFTLAHELAHIWLGESALSNASPTSSDGNSVETWCNAVAAEFLMPLELVCAEVNLDAPIATEVPRLAKRFKVSTLVVLRRLHDAGRLTRAQFFAAYEEEVDHLAEILGRRRKGKPDFYLTTAARVSRRFASALVESTLEGRTLYRDAFRMLGISKSETLHQLGRSLHFNI